MMAADCHLARWRNPDTGRCEHTDHDVSPVDRIIAASLRDGGGTFLPDGTPYGGFPPMLTDRRHAYAVAVRGIGRYPESYLAAGVEAATNLVAPGQYIGTWRDADGTWYIDLVRVIYSRSHAVRLGRRYAQLAIYDLTAGEVVTL